MCFLLNITICCRNTRPNTIISSTKELTAQSCVRPQSAVGVTNKKLEHHSPEMRSVPDIFMRRVPSHFKDYPHGKNNASVSEEKKKSD